MLWNEAGAAQFARKVGEGRTVGLRKFLASPITLDGVDGSDFSGIAFSAAALGTVARLPIWLHNDNARKYMSFSSQFALLYVWLYN